MAILINMEVEMDQDYMTELVSIQAEENPVGERLYARENGGCDRPF